jgi:nitrous oxide reductase accessory protein NosL
MTRASFLLALGFSALVATCKNVPDAPGPSPINVPDTDQCAAMCQHIGPKAEGGLGCEEGEPVFDSDKGRNVSCQEFCEATQTNGAFLNPRCVKKVGSCDEIESARKKTCAD